MFKNMLFIIMTLLVSPVYAIAQVEDNVQTEQNKTVTSYLYSWTDDKGVIHITDNVEKVPKKYRNKTIRLDQRDREVSAENAEVQPGTRPPSSSDAQDAGDDSKIEWQQRMKAAKTRLVNAERHYRELDDRRTKLRMRAPYAPLPTAVMAEAEQVEQEMQKVQDEIREAQNEVDVVIPEEARKAGIPPGWLRE
jgi:hypothetical protein